MSKMYFGKNMSFWKIWLKSDRIVFFAAFLHRIACCKICFRFFLENYYFWNVFKTLSLKNIKMRLFRLWEYQKTIPHGEKLLGAYFKTYFDWKIN